MPRDPRTYITVHDGMPDHPKIDPLSDGAFRLIITMWCWCSRNKTDGKIPAATWKKRGTPKTRAELIAAGLVEHDGADLRMHDYLQHQRSADEIAALQQKRSEAGAKGGKAKAKGLASAKQVLEQTGSKAVADTDTELPRDTSRKTREDALTSTEDPRFVEFWQAYPRHEAKAAALKALANALKRTTIEEIVKGAQRYRDDPNRQGEFTKLPTTWLNQGCWDDDPLPVQLTRRPQPRDEDDDMGWAR